MKISQILDQSARSGCPTISFEVFPPKESASFERVESAALEIAALNPAFLSVTYGAGGGRSRWTMELSRQIQEKSHVPVMAHLTCVSSTKKVVREKIQEIQSLHIDNVMALRGDIPESMQGDTRETWDYHYATELISEIRKTAPDICIGAACYPETHPESASRASDLQHLREKVDAGVDFLTTQMFFDNELFYRFLYMAREKGIGVPIIPGIMPITSRSQIDRALRLSGSFMPQRFLSLADRFGDQPHAMAQCGLIYAADQIIDLMANGIPHVHVYTMNKPEVAATLISHLSAILGRKLS
ncbi:MAG: methylenetetrahydrofolate reductase [Clostridia bacterium]|nr:methylenetetrahydrofolate reductase [Clostridia bacterium]